MDLKTTTDEATPAEKAAIAAAVPNAKIRNGRVVRIDRNLRHHLLGALAATQDAIGWVSPGAMNEIAVRLQVPPAEVFAVASFYALLSTGERSGPLAHVCDDVACGPDLINALGDRPDVAASPCLGQCDLAPAAFIQRPGAADTVVTSATPEAISSALDGGVPASEPTHVSAGPLLARVGNVDPSSLDDYRSRDGYLALARALEMGPDAVIDEVTTSNLRGRGGAAFPTGIKWKGARSQPGPRFVVCNADESEPGTFKDRTVIEGDPFSLIEALTIAGVTVGADHGYIYLRGEYPDSYRVLAAAISAVTSAGLLGDDILGHGIGFNIEIRRGQGAYICGEETALFSSIEGYRGEPRQKPPFPTESGLFGRPTVVNNVETLINIPRIILEGGAAYAATGTNESTGTRLFCLSGDVERPGVYEVPSGTTLGTVIAGAGGRRSDIAYLLLGGAAGSLTTTDVWDLPLTFEDTRAAGVTLGSGVIMAFGPDRDMAATVRRVARFFRDESCGQCVPCRVGTVRIEETVNQPGPIDSGLIADLDRAMKDASICGLGHTAASVVRAALDLGVFDE